MICKDSFKVQTMTAFNKKLLRMLHGAVFSKRVPLAAGGKIKKLQATQPMGLLRCGGFYR